jgi:hypothetical protein
MLWKSQINLLSGLKKRGKKMGFIKWAEDIMKKFKWYDVKLAQIAAIFATLTLITLWPAFLETVQKLDWYWYLIFAIITGLPLVKRMFFD